MTANLTKSKLLTVFEENNFQNLEILSLAFYSWYLHSKIKLISFEFFKELFALFGWWFNGSLSGKSEEFASKKNDKIFLFIFFVTSKSYNSLFIILKGEEN